jgi:hypothetical protein
MLLLAAVALAGAARLPSEAPLYLVLRPTQLAEDVTFLNLAARTQPDVARAEDELRDTLHFDPFKVADWRRIGIDPDAPVLLALGRSDPTEVERVLTALDRGRPTPPAALQHRVVARVGDPTRLKTFLGDLLRTPFGKQLRATTSGDELVLDIATPLGGGRGKAPVLPTALGLATDRGAARLLGEGAVSVYLALSRWPALITASGVSQVAAALAQPKLKARVRSQIGKQGALEIRSCRDEWSRTGGALFDDFAAAGRLGMGAWEMQAVWGANALGRVGLEAAAGDDGILDAAATQDAVLVAQLFLSGTGIFRGVQRVGVMRNATYAGQKLRECGALAWVLAGLRYWPQGLAFALDEIGQDPELGLITGALRNAAFVIRSLNGPNHLEGAAALTLEPSARAWLDQNCKSRERVKRKNRDLTVCSAPTSARERVVWEQPAAGPALMAWLSDARLIDWWASQRRPPARPHPEALATVRVDVAKLVGGALNDADAMTRAAVGALTAGRTAARGSLRLDGDLLRAELRIDSNRKP